MKVRYSSILFLSLGLHGAFVCAFRPPEFVIVIPSYNNEKWCQKNLDSVVKQRYPFFKVAYVNDCSTDKTKELVNAYIQNSPFKHRIAVTHNTQRLGSLHNIYNAVHSCPNHKIIVLVDGDDMLYSDSVLDKLAHEYTNKNIWLTYGQYISSSGFLGMSKAFSQDIIKKNKFRKVGWRSSHLRTFYAGLFKHIKLEDFQYNGVFFSAGGDLAFMYPMLEMASLGHFKFIRDILYIYNIGNPLSDSRINIQAQAFASDIICSRQPYKPLKSRAF